MSETTHIFDKAIAKRDIAIANAYRKLRAIRDNYNKKTNLLHNVLMHQEGLCQITIKRTQDTYFAECDAILKKQADKL